MSKVRLTKVFSARVQTGKYLWTCLMLVAPGTQTASPGGGAVAEVSHVTVTHPPSILTFGPSTGWIGLNLAKQDGDQWLNGTERQTFYRQNMANSQ